MTPHVTGCDMMWPNSPVGTRMPALASANTGTTTNADHGWSRNSSHSTTETDSWAWRDNRDAAWMSSSSSRSPSSAASTSVRVTTRRHRREQAERDAGERGVDVGFVEAPPTERSEREIDADERNPGSDEIGDDERADTAAASHGSETPLL